jgi:hypothetical protein
MMALVLVGLVLALVIVSILGWTADSRDDTHKVWPLERPQRDNTPKAPEHDDYVLRDIRPDAAPTRTREGVSLSTTGRSP